MPHTATISFTIKFQYIMRQVTGSAVKQDNWVFTYIRKKFSKSRKIEEGKRKGSGRRYAYARQRQGWVVRANLFLLM